MKAFKSVLRVWLAATSAVIFLATWVILGHSPNPIDSRSHTSVASLPTIAPFQPLSDEDARPFGWQLFSQNNRQQQQPRARFVTGGS